MRLALPALAVAASAACTPASRAVVRLHDGLEVRGPRISEEAYAAYAEAAELEARGELSRALVAYERALERDPDSAELWTRVADARCRLGEEPMVTLFVEAIERYPDYAPLWTAKAHCHISREEVVAARHAALRAAALGPNDPETTDAVVAALARGGDAVSAQRWRAAARLRSGAPPERDPPAVPSDVDEALGRGDLLLARHLATRARLSQGEVALRAVAVGKPDLAVEQGTLVLTADPDDADAWIALLAASDLSGNESQFAHWLHHPPSAEAEAGPLALETLAELIDRRIGQGDEPLRNLAAALRQGMDE